MYSKIVNPVTGRFVKANSLLGKRIINNYIQSAGGSVSRPVPEPEPEPEHTDDAAKVKTKAAEVKAAEVKAAEVKAAEAKADYIARQRAYAAAEARRLLILDGVQRMVRMGWDSNRARGLLNRTDGDVEKAVGLSFSSIALYDQPYVLK